MGTTIRQTLAPIWKRLLQQELTAPDLLALLHIHGGLDTEKFTLPPIEHALEGTLTDWSTLDFGLDEVMAFYSANIDDPEATIDEFIAGSIFVVLAASDSRRAFSPGCDWQFTGPKTVLLFAGYPRFLTTPEIRSIAHYICKEIVDF